MAPIHLLFDIHEHCNPEWCPTKANKRVSNGKYRNVDNNKEMFDCHVGKRMEGEKLKALHHSFFDTQMIEVMNNNFTRSLAPKACFIE